MAARGVWFKPEVWPVIAAIGGGIALSSWFGTRQLRKHNDIVINKNEPRQYLKSDYEKIVTVKTDLYNHGLDKSLTAAAIKN